MQGHVSGLAVLFHACDTEGNRSRFIQIDLFGPVFRNGGPVEDDDTRARSLQLTAGLEYYY